MPRQVREMGLTPEEFLRTLPAAIGHRQYSVDRHSIEVHDPGGEIRIELRPLPPRVLGRLTLPVTRVEITFREFSDRQQQLFLLRLERYYQRGGG